MKISDKILYVVFMAVCVSMICMIGITPFTRTEVGKVATEHGRTPPIEINAGELASVLSTWSTWRTPTQSGMAPLHVLKTTSQRMQYEQGTDLGSDANARALILVMEAVAILEGRDKTVDGIKVID